MRGEPAGPLEQRRLKNRFPGLDASSHRSQPLIGTQESTGSICCHSQIIFCQRRRRNRCCLHPLSFHQRGQARFSRRPWSCCFPKRPSVVERVDTASWKQHHIQKITCSSHRGAPSLVM